MDESEQAIADLRSYEAMLVTARRRLISTAVHGNKNEVRAPGAPYQIAVGPSTSRSAEIRALQEDIDAVRRAIRDELGDASALPASGEAV